MRAMIDKHIDWYIGVIGIISTFLILIIDWYVGVIGFLLVGIIVVIGLEK